MQSLFSTPRFHQGASKSQLLTYHLAVEEDAVETESTLNFSEKLVGVLNGIEGEELGEASSNLRELRVTLGAPGERCL